MNTPIDSRSTSSESISTIADIMVSVTGIVKKNDEWSIGITAKPEEMRARHGNPAEWYCWDAQFRTMAMIVRDVLVGEGMKRISEAEPESKFVYIFRK